MNNTYYRFNNKTQAAAPDCNICINKGRQLSGL